MSHCSQRSKPMFVLLTDFGYDFAVGCMKGVLLKGFPDATIIDLDHSIEKFNVASGRFVLARSYRYFPKGTIFLCIIDPGVGTKREPLCVKTPDYAFIGPNNGLFDEILSLEPHHILYEIDNSYLAGKANTFHGRDLFAPAAIDVYKGHLEHLKPFDASKLHHLMAAHNQSVITYIDSFGNIKTNKLLPAGGLQRRVVLRIAGQLYKIPFVGTFKEVNVGELLCYRGSNNTLEIAINQGSAAKRLKAHVGDTITFDY